MTEFKDDPFYPVNLSELPATWATSFIGSVIPDVQSGFPCGIHNREIEGIPHLRPMNVTRNGNLDLADVKYVSPDVSALRISAGDVLFNNTNSPELIGKTAVIPRAVTQEMAFSNHMTRLRPPAGISASFVAYQLHYLWMSGYFRHRCTNHVNQASLSGSTLADSVPLIVAPSKEQTRIVEEIEKQLTRIDAAMAALTRVQANLKRYRASVLKAACEGRLVPSEAELARKEGRDYEPADKLLGRILRERRARWEADTLAKMVVSGKPPRDDSWKQKYKEPSPPNATSLPPLPDGWCWASLDEIAIIQGGITKGQKRRGETLRSVPYLRVANVQRGFLDLSELKEIEATEEEIGELSLRIGDILFNEGGDRDKLGRGWVWEGQVPLCIHQNHVFRARLLVAEIEPRFVSSYANAYGRTYFFDEGKQTTNLASLNMTKLRGLPIPLPPGSEQSRIIKVLDGVVDFVQRQEGFAADGILKLASLRRAILTAAFSGNLVAQEPSDEPAMVLVDRIRTRPAQEKVQKGSEAKRTQRKRGQLIQHRTRPRKTIVDTLIEAGKPLTPEMLFSASGHQSETIEVFYDELKAAIGAGLVEEVRRGTGVILLQVI